MLCCSWLAIADEVDLLKLDNTTSNLEPHMNTLTKKPLFSRTKKLSCVPLRLTAVVASFFLVMPLLTGCGEGENGGNPAVAVTGSTASLEWSPVADPSVSSYFVHYGRQSPSQPGSCAYESSVSVDSSSATLTNLDPNTLYYFTVSAYNGLESPCSNEVSTVTPPV
jgi:hypothetical protein